MHVVAVSLWQFVVILTLLDEIPRVKVPKGFMTVDETGRLSGHQLSVNSDFDYTLQNWEKATLSQTLKGMWQAELTSPGAEKWSLKG